MTLLSFICHGGDREDPLVCLLFRDDLDILRRTGANVRPRTSVRQVDGNLFPISENIEAACGCEISGDASRLRYTP